MKVIKSPDLTHLSTFRAKSVGRELVVLEKTADLDELQTYLRDKEYVVLGGGSNTLFETNVDKLIVKIELRGIEIIDESSEYVVIEVAAGENWNEFVEYTICQNLGGVENLVLIPGTVGGAVVQQIGAYGQEIKDVVQEVSAYNPVDGQTINLSGDECGFIYRDSHFKSGIYTGWIVLSAKLRLHKDPQPNLMYGPIAEAFGTTVPTIRDVADKVIEIRRSKLPDIHTIGSGGSYFKNPIVSIELAESLMSEYPDMPQYDSADGQKLSAGWLIEQCGWKGKNLGGYGVYDKHSLVLVNYDEVEGDKIISLAEDIKDSVYQKFGVNLEPEIKIVK